MGFIQREIVYKTVDEVELKLHLFEADGRDKSVRVPAIVFFFGGGWRAGTPEQFFPHCRHLASRGMVAISAEYRVKSRHGVTPFECVLDAKSALRWVRAHAEGLGIGPERVVAGGGSAGGHLAACAAAVEGLEGEDPGASSMPNALVLFNPVVDTTREPIQAHGFGDLAEKLSPVHHVRPGLPPTIIFHGIADTTVPFSTVEQFRDLMQQAGNRCELVGFAGKGHGFFNYGRDGNEPYEETVQAMDVFLVSLGYLESDRS
jgi:acetyl esterase/lipase